MKIHFQLHLPLMSSESVATPVSVHGGLSEHTSVVSEIHFSLYACSEPANQKTKSFVFSTKSLETDSFVPESARTKVFCFSYKLAHNNFMFSVCVSVFANESFVFRKWNIARSGSMLLMKAFFSVVCLSRPLSFPHWQVEERQLMCPNSGEGCSEGHYLPTSCR